MPELLRELFLKLFAYSGNFGLYLVIWEYQHAQGQMHEHVACWFEFGLVSDFGKLCRNVVLNASNFITMRLPDEG